MTPVLHRSRNSSELMSAFPMKPPKIGAHYQGDGRCIFTLWAPLKGRVAVRLLAADSQTEDRVIPLERDDSEAAERGYWQATVTDVAPGSRYWFQIDGEDYPDPVSYAQPEGVHGPSVVVDHSAFSWHDQLGSLRSEGRWDGLPLSQYVIYELHVGTFTHAGTFEAVIPRLDDLKALGVTAIEIMPVAQFPGDRNWGYDGVFPFATQASYGGVEGLKKLVDACHQAGMAIILDVVYNHLGPEGNYLWHLGTYFTEQYKTPWGSAVNYDRAYSDGVREYVIQNALYWLETCHIDALRLDAVHAIYDCGAQHILKEMRDRVSRIPGAPRYLIAESDANDPRIIEPTEIGGYGLDGQWSDDFHHALHTCLTGETHGYYADFGRLSQLAKAYGNPFVYAWDYSSYRQRMHGFPARRCQSQQFVISAQNHDQVGNRMLGDRFTHLLSYEGQKLAAAALLLAPFVPMLFMGEEYGETAPFLYFVSHGDEALIESVRQGRKQEFAAFHAEGETGGAKAPDPQSVEVFEKSKLNWSLKDEGKHRLLWRFYRELLRLRREDPALMNLDHRSAEAHAREREQVLTLRRWNHEDEVLACMNFSDRSAEIHLSLHPGTWHLVLDSADVVWGGPGHEVPEHIPLSRHQPVTQQKLTLAPQSVVVYSTNNPPPV